MLHLWLKASLRTDLSNKEARKKGRNKQKELNMKACKNLKRKRGKEEETQPAKAEKKMSVKDKRGAKARGRKGKKMDLKRANIPKVQDHDAEEDAPRKKKRRTAA